MATYLRKTASMDPTGDSLGGYDVVEVGSFEER